MADTQTRVLPAREKLENRTHLAVKVQSREHNKKIKSEGRIIGFRKTPPINRPENEMKKKKKRENQKKSNNARRGFPPSPREISRQRRDSNSGGPTDESICLSLKRARALKSFFTNPTKKRFF